jgi:hypothetical protein
MCDVLLVFHKVGLLDTHVASLEGSVLVLFVFALGLKLLKIKDSGFTQGLNQITIT